MSAVALINRAWGLASAPAARRFARALDDPGAVQRRRLRSLIRRNAATAFGMAHGFAAIVDAASYRRAVPLRSYEDFLPWIERIRRGERGVLTQAQPTRLVPTGGSSGGAKLIPWTTDAAAEFRAAVAPWIVDLQRAFPEVRDGPAYWSITPAAPPPESVAAGPPIGFDDDSAYLGGVLAPLAAATFAAPSSMGRIADLPLFRTLTMRCLLARADLRLISVWNPTFLQLLLDHAAAERETLIAAIARGGAPPSLDGGLAAALRPWLRPDPERARMLADADWSSPRALWPRLAVVSCWADAAAAAPAQALAHRLDGVPLQAKGLLATEAAVSVPWRGRTPAAVGGAVLEFLDRDGSPRWIDELADGMVYEVVLTTGSGLFRYRLGDLVRVEGFVGRTPSLRFLGRAGAVSDLVGEKLDEAFVAQALATLPVPMAFAALQPRTRPGFGYALLIGGARADARLAELLDESLRRNPQYDLARRLGQLAPVRAVRLAGDAGQCLAALAAQRGQRLGDCKPPALLPATVVLPEFADG